jgi:hypothetical protein
MDVDDIDFTAQSAEGFTYQKMHYHLPAISMDCDDDTIYFKAVHKFSDQTGYLVYVDMRNKALKVSSPLPSPWTEPIVHVPSPRSTLAPSNYISSIILNMMVICAFLANLFLCIISL